MAHQDDLVPATRGWRELLRKKREKGWSQTSLASALGTEQGVVQPWLKRKSRPSHRYQIVMQRVLDIEPSDWLTADEYRQIYGEAR